MNMTMFQDPSLMKFGVNLQVKEKPHILLKTMTLYNDIEWFKNLTGVSRFLLVYTV